MYKPKIGDLVRSRGSHHIEAALGIILPSTVEEEKKHYSRIKIWWYDDLAPTFETPEMVDEYREIFLEYSEEC